MPVNPARRRGGRWRTFTTNGNKHTSTRPSPIGSTDPTWLSEPTRLFACAQPNEPSSSPTVNPCGASREGRGHWASVVATSGSIPGCVDPDQDSQREPCAQRWHLVKSRQTSSNLVKPRQASSSLVKSSSSLVKSSSDDGGGDAPPAPRDIGAEARLEVLAQRVLPCVYMHIYMRGRGRGRLEVLAQRVLPCVYIYIYEG